MFGFGKKYKAQEEHMAQWLAHPNEFGVAPKSVKHKRAYKGALMGHGPVEIHLIDYEMPDGTRGRGFENGPLTWSFLGDNVKLIGDDDLLVAYCGWAWLFPALQSGGVQTDFVSEGEESRYLAQKQEQGLTDVQIDGRYKIGTSELYGFRANYQGQPVRGAGNTENETGFGADQPQYHLPSIYFLLGQQVIQHMR